MNHNKILQLTTGNEKLRRHFCKSYLHLAKVEFKKQNKRWPEPEDAQAVYDLYETQWRDWYIDRPERERVNRIKGRPLWQYAIQFRLDVYASLCRFIEFKYGRLVTGKYGNVYPEKSCGDILKEMGIELMETHIIDNGLAEEYYQFIDDNKATLSKWFKAKFQDYSDMAYNNSSDDL